MAGLSGFPCSHWLDAHAYCLQVLCFSSTRPLRRRQRHWADDMPSTLQPVYRDWENCCSITDFTSVNTSSIFLFCIDDSMVTFDDAKHFVDSWSNLSLMSNRLSSRILILSNRVFCRIAGISSLLPHIFDAFLTCSAPFGSMTYMLVPFLILFFRG